VPKVAGLKPWGSFEKVHVELPPRPVLNEAEMLPSTASPFTMPVMLDFETISRS